MGSVESLPRVVMTTSGQIPDRVVEAALPVLAAKASKWSYNPTPEPSSVLPTDLPVGDYKLKIEYNTRKILYADHDEQAQKVSLVATITAHDFPEPVRVFLLAFRGTVTAQDWMANLSAVRNEEALAKYGIDVHAGWHALLSNTDRQEDLKSALAEEHGRAGGLGRVLFCGHSMGGALAQVAAFMAYAFADSAGASGSEIGALLKDRLRAITFAAPMPFAPKPAAELRDPAKGDMQQVALEWFAGVALNYVNNNDLVPRLPGRCDFLKGFLNRCSNFTVSVAIPAPMVKVGLGTTLRPADVFAALEKDMPGLQRYLSLARTVFVGHARGLPGVFYGDAAHSELAKEQTPDPRAASGPQNWMSGGLHAAVDDHDVKSYVALAYTMRYEGEYREGLKHGRGTFTFAHGDLYEGEWHKDMKHGRGTLTFASGSRYEGEWHKDMKHGRGTYASADGDLYEGEWHENMKHGRGTFTWADGDLYEGEWHESKYHGRGTYTFADGSRYDGEWHNDKKHGRVTFTSADGPRGPTGCFPPALRTACVLR